MIGNTTCPASDIAEADTHLDALHLILSQYDEEASPFGLCPPPLFGEMIRINYLRAQASACVDESELASISIAADETRERIRSFSPEQWASRKELSRDEWERMASVWHTAITLYCILSLPPLYSQASLPTNSTDLDAAESLSCAQDLRRLLREALSSPRIRRVLVWPLAVLGVHAARQDSATRRFVSDSLAQLSRQLGTYTPLRAREVLQKFWASGKEGWDDCFDKPYMFTTQVAVNIAGLMRTERGSLNQSSQRVLPTPLKVQ